MLDDLVEKLLQKEPEKELRENFLQSLRHEIEDKGKSGGHVVWAIRNYAKYEIREAEEIGDSDYKIETENDYPEADYNSEKYI